MEKPKQFKTKDFYQAVVLKTAGLPLLRLEKSSGHFFVFVFNDLEDKAQEIITSYWKNNLKVDAKGFIENINELKTRIHSEV